MSKKKDPQHDLAIVIVSANDAEWLPHCLSSILGRTGNISIEIVVVDSGSTDGTAEVVEEQFPEVRLLRATNRGFAAGNNRALPTCSARHVLFLNPDTEILKGDLASMVELMDARPGIGLLGCRHLLPNGGIQKTMRRFPSPGRVWGEALGCSDPPFGLPALGEIVQDARAYETEHVCDWVAGSFMLVRMEAIAGAGYMDERFFLYSEEIDFCLRVTEAGWKVLYSPTMTILHHAGKAGFNPKLQAQNAFARRQYARKHFGKPRRALFIAGLAAHYGLRMAMTLGTPAMRQRHQAAGHCARVSLGIEGPPFPLLTSVTVSSLVRPDVHSR